MKTSELTGALLDYWVARAGPHSFYEMGENWPGNSRVHAEANERPVVIRNLMGELWVEHRGASVRYAPSADWAQGGPIIERERIMVTHTPLDGAVCWHATANEYATDAMPGPTPLVAAMRAYVASRFGDEVPDERAASTQEGAKNG